jgi:N-acetylmuramoyl-L-alanine amidase
MNRRHFTAFLTLAVITISLTSFTEKEKRPTQKQPLKRIVIDPGHGGSDGGARGRYSNESDIALAIGMKPFQMLKWL